MDPLAPVDELLDWLVGTVLHLALGVAVAMIAARLMRREHLHWSWAAIALALLALLRGSLGSFCATADRSRTMRNVVELSLAPRRSRVRGRSRRDSGPSSQPTRDRAFPYAGSESTATRFPHATRRNPSRRDSDRTRRKRSSGAYPFRRPGRRKAHTDRGRDGLRQDGHRDVHGSPRDRARDGSDRARPQGRWSSAPPVASATAEAGRAFIEWTPDGACVYNPFASGGETEIADKALAGERFTEPHYQRQAQRYLGHVVRALRSSAGEVSLCRIVELLDPNELEQLARGLSEADATPTFAYLDSLSARQRSDLAGVRDRLAILVESDVGRWLDPRSTSTERLDLPAATRSRSTVYFSLESDSRPLLAQMLGAAIVQDLQSTVAVLQRSPVPTMVVIDEFSAIAAEQLVRLFGRARSAGFSLLLGTQELSDLRLPGRERLLEQVMGNLSVLIAHRQVVPSSAALIAEVAGKKGAWRVSRHSDGRTTRIRTREGALDSSRVMSLAPGCAAVIVPGAVEGARIARVFPS